jgi:hypothetical protein
MTLISTRTRLDELLTDEELTLMLLVGDSGSLAQTIDDFISAKVTATQEWRRGVLLRDLDLLTTAERKDWKPGADLYVVLGGMPREVAESDALDELLRGDGAPSIMYIRGAFGAGDEL